jgi:GTP cyclohydrolase I
VTHKDIQSEKDFRNMPIEKVGVKNVRLPIIVEDRANKYQHTIADVDLYVDLPHEHRGTHMSRFIEVLYSFHGETMIDNLKPLLQKVKQKLHSKKAYISIRFPYFIKKTAPVSQLTSMLDYQCTFEASLDDKFVFWIVVKAPVTSLCPCSKEVSDYGAHNQRSYVTIKLRYTSFIWIEELVELIEKSASCEIYPLLKRPDEKFVTEKAYENPAFVEDIVRDIALSLDSDERVSHFSVESENIESIHDHSAYAMISREKNAK